MATVYQEAASTSYATAITIPPGTREIIVWFYDDDTNEDYQDGRVRVTGRTLGAASGSTTIGFKVPAAAGAPLHIPCPLGSGIEVSISARIETGSGKFNLICA